MFNIKSTRIRFTINTHSLKCCVISVGPVMGEAREDNVLKEALLCIILASSSVIHANSVRRVERKI